MTYDQNDIMGHVYYLTYYGTWPNAHCDWERYGCGSISGVDEGLQIQQDSEYRRGAPTRLVICPYDGEGYLSPYADCQEYTPWEGEDSDLTDKYASLVYGAE